MGGWLRRVRLVADRVDVPALVEEFAVTSLHEIDYLHEAANAERFAADFADDPRVHVPEIIWERTTRRVLTLSDVSAIKINDLDGLRAAGIDPADVARATLDGVERDDYEVVVDEQTAVIKQMLAGRPEELYAVVAQMLAA